MVPALKFAILSLFPPRRDPLLLGMLSTEEVVLESFFS